MTLFFNNSEIIVLRSRRLGSAHRYAMSATFTALPATIEPASPERTEFIGGRPGHVFTGFVDTSHRIIEGDRIVVMSSDNTRGKKYEVRGVSYWQGAGMLDHIELTLISEVGEWTSILR